MSKFVDGLGNIWEGVTGLISGVGGQAQAGADITRANAQIAAQQQAQEAAAQEAAAQKEKMIVWAAIAIVIFALAMPLIIVAAKK